MLESWRENLKALTYYQSGADLGGSASLFGLGKILILGEHGQAIDYERGINLIRRSTELADADYPRGAYTYGMLLAQNLPQMAVPEQCLAKDLNAVRDNIKKAAFLGYPKAQLEIARAYELKDLNSGFNPALSLHYCLLAASQDNAEAEMLISKWFLGGAEGQFEKNQAVSFVYAQRAAGRGWRMRGCGLRD
jgi:hypothetical protein